MYPNLYFAFKDLFGITWSPLRFINSFGFFVALSFIAAAVTLSKELLRKEREGLLQGKDQMVVIGKPASLFDLLVNFILGFIVAYKLVGLFTLDSSVTANPQDYIKSSAGNFPAGLLLGLILAGWKWYEKNKQKLPKPEKRTIRIWPQDRVGEMTILALIFGLIGAKMFDIFENWSGFLKDPSSYLFSPSGLTFYGGLICAALAIWIYARKHKITFWHLNDAAAPALMLAYAVGRIGCQVSGDGDWGIYNSAYAVDQETHISVAARPGQFQEALQGNSTFFLREHQNLDVVPHKAFKRPGALSFLPVWFFAYDYPHNVNDFGVPIANCNDKKYCNHLPVPVFPTSLYEVIAGLLLFALLWAVRKKLKVPGALFALYLMVNGLERFFVEKIRVNTRIESLPFRPTQAEVISALLFLTGLILWFVLKRKAAREISTT